jgi:WAS protein family, member 3
MLKDTDRMINKKHKQPRTTENNIAGSGGGHKKRVRQPHNTREKQRQIAIGHGETLMPNNVIYRTPNQIMNAHDEVYNSMGVYDPTRPARPNSIEIRRSYPAESVDGSTGGYLQPQQQSPSYNQTSSNYSQQMYDDGEYASQQQQQQMYGQGQGPLSSESLYAPGTPSRGGYGTGKSRPSVPPPAPPSTGSNGGTPNASNANTPTRGRSMSTGRDALPPPPPIPEGLQSPPLNGNGGIMAAKILGRSSSTSRSGSPQLGQNMLQPDPNALVMAQLNSQINNLNNINHQMNQLNDLPPPPPIPDQHHLQQQQQHHQHHLSPKMMAHHAHHAAPPPPPPPPMDLNINGGLQSPPQQIHQMGNGDLHLNGIILGGKILKKVPPKKATPFEDTRTDLMKAIRDGEFNNKLKIYLNPVYTPIILLFFVFKSMICFCLTQSNAFDSSKQNALLMFNVC